MITLKNILELPYMKDIQPLYPISNASKITVKNIAILEAPIENFVRKGEIVVSTALSVRDHEDTLFHFIQEIQSAGASALILAFPDNSYEILESISTHFQSLDFPILLAPWSLHFADIVENTLRKIWAQSEENHVQMEELQKQLLNCYLQDGTYSDAACIISSFFQCDTIIADMNLTVKGSSQPILQQDFSNLLLNKENELTRIDIEAFDKSFGYIILYSLPDTIDLQSLQENICEYCNNAITLWFTREWSLTSIKMRSQEDFVWKIAHHEYDDTNKLMSRAKAMHFQTDCHYVCIVGSPVLEKDLRAGHTELSFQAKAQLQSSTTILQEQILHMTHSMGLSVMTTYQNQYLIIYLQRDTDEDSYTFVKHYLDNLESHLRSSLPNLAFLWGFDSQKSGFDMLHKSFANAKEALKLCKELKPSDYRCCYQFSLIKKIDSILCSNKEIMETVLSILKPIIEYDRAKNSDLLLTLEYYCENNYNVSETARAQHLHRQSLLYRLEKIENLCNLSLKNHEHLYLLDTCIQLYRNF